MVQAKFSATVVTVAWLLGAQAALGQVDPSAQLGSPYRRLAPGVETVIPADVDPEEIVMRHPMTSLLAQADLAWEPNFWPQTRTLQSMAQRAEFYREAWCLEFVFKPLRMIEVDVPQPSGRLQRKLIWYMVYHVTNTGVRLKPVVTESDVVRAEPADGAPVQFFPHFVLESHDRDANGNRIYKAYLDRILPTALDAIQQREDPNREFLTTVEMAGRELPVAASGVSQGAWGVVTWEDVDAKIDFFSIYVEGLSNAYKWRDSA
jgi:hypothetical protein